MISSGFIKEYKDFVYQRVKQKHGLGGMIKAATQAVIEFEPDLIVYITGWSKDDLPNQLLAGFEEVGIRVLTIAWDTYPGPTPLDFRQNRLFKSTSIFCEACSFITYARLRFWREQLNPEKAVIYLSGNNILYNHFSELSLNKDIDVLLLGSLYKNRQNLLTFLREKLSSLGITVKHLGGYFDESYGLPDNKKTHTLKRLSNEDYIKAINRSRIILCPSGATGQWAVRGKIFEIIACKGFCLAEDNFDIRQTIPTEKLNTYKTHEECLSQILYFLNNVAARSHSIKISHEWYLKNYNSIHFWQDFFYKFSIRDNNYQNTPFVEANYHSIKDKLLNLYGKKKITPEKIVGFSIE